MMSEVPEALTLLLSPAERYAAVIGPVACIQHLGQLDPSVLVALIASTCRHSP